MERYQTIRAYSAGGVVFRRVPVNEDIWNGTSKSKQADTGAPISIEVALVGRSHSGMWALPKGTPNAGETIEQVALREVREETGLEVRLVAYIGSISYSFIRDQVRFHKQVRHFLFEAVGGDVALHDHEYDRVAWFPLPEASRLLTYQNEAYILNQADGILQRWLSQQQKEGRV